MTHLGLTVYSKETFGCTGTENSGWKELVCEDGTGMKPSHDAVHAVGSVGISKQARTVGFCRHFN